MTNKQVLSLILSRLARKRVAPEFENIVVLEIQSQVAQIEKTMKEAPWFLETVWEGVLEKDMKSLRLPEDFLMEVEESGMILEDPSGSRHYVTKRILDRIQQAQALTTRPRFYGIYEHYLHFGPVPDKRYTFRLPYARKSVVFAPDDSPVRDWFLEAFNAISHTVQYHIAAYHLHDMEMAQKFQGPMQQAWAQFHDYANKRRYTNLTIQAGDEDES